MDFLRSRANVLGMVMATLVIIVHLVIGLGALWPVAAVAVWGATAALVPRARKGPGEIEPIRPRLSLDPAELSDALQASGERLAGGAPQCPLADAFARTSTSVQAILAEWNHLASYPEQQVIVASIIEDHLPGIIDSYLGVPVSARPQATGPAIESLSVLLQECERIRAAIGQDDVRVLENHRDMLRMQFGLRNGLPGQSPDPEIRDEGGQVR